MSEDTKKMINAGNVNYAFFICEISILYLFILEFEKKFYICTR